MKLHLPMILTLIAVSVFFSGCSTNMLTDPVADLVNRPWNLQTYNDGTGHFIPVDPSEAFIMVFSPDGRFNGSGGSCLSLTGRYTADGQVIKLSDVSPSYGSGCAAGSEARAMYDRYVDLLTNSTKFNVDDNQMSLSYYDVRKFLIFAKE